MSGRNFARRSTLVALHIVLAGGGLLLASQGPQFPPLGTGISPEEKATLQASVEQLSGKVAALKRRVTQLGRWANRIADVEVYLDAVRRPLKYDERLYAGRGSTPVAVARQTLATGTERAERLESGQAPWMTRERRARLLFAGSTARRSPTS